MCAMAGIQDRNGPALSFSLIILLITNIAFTNAVRYVIESGYMHAVSFGFWEGIRPTVDDVHSQTTGFSFGPQCNPTSASFQPQSAPVGDKKLHIGFQKTATPIMVQI